MTDHLGFIKDVDDLHYYLIQGMMIEHATLPPYLTALYSIKPGTNLEAFHVIRAVAVEEMLHLTLAANVFNAVGGNIEGVLTDPEFVPKYPTYLPTGEREFKVGVRKFSQETIKTFLDIERSKEVPEEEPIVPTKHEQRKLLRAKGSLDFYSIGLFYAQIIQGLQYLYYEKGMGDDLFCGDPAKQISPEFYYSGAGDVITVTDLRTAMQALRVIQEQGEGSRTGAIYDAEREICHYYRFQELFLGQHYVVDKMNPTNSDEPGHPTGETFEVDWDAVYPIIDDAKLSDFPEGSEVHTHAQAFQTAYSQFLADIEFSFNGNPEKLIPAVGGMFKLKELFNTLMRNPIPGKEGVNAAPIFRLD